MRTPTRKIGTYSHLRPDQHITIEKYNKLKAEHHKLIKFVRPPAIEEVKRLALMGDFSENAAYQIAKGRLRGINQRLIDIENLLNRSEIINPSANGRVQLGSIVEVSVNDKIKQYKILGSTETNPSQGIISHNSPIGQALMRKKVGEIIKVEIKDKEIEYKILKIE